MTTDEKKNLFVERLSMGISRFKIQDRFNQIDSHTARFKIAEYAYLVLLGMVEEDDERINHESKAGWIGEYLEYNNAEDRTLDVKPILGITDATT